MRVDLRWWRGQLLDDRINSPIQTLPGMRLARHPDASRAGQVRLPLSCSDDCWTGRACHRHDIFRAILRSRRVANAAL